MPTSEFFVTHHFRLLTNAATTPTAVEGNRQCSVNYKKLRYRKVNETTKKLKVIAIGMSGMRKSQIYL